MENLKTTNSSSHQIYAVPYSYYDSLVDKEIFPKDLFYLLHSDTGEFVCRCDMSDLGITKFHNYSNHPEKIVLDLDEVKKFNIKIG